MPKFSSNINISLLIYTRMRSSCQQPHDFYRPEREEAFARYFKSGKRPTMQETALYTH